MNLSSYTKSIASLITCATLTTAEIEAAVSPTPTVNVPLHAPPLTTTDFVRVTAPSLAIPIESAPLTCEVGKHLMLIQENDHFFITMCSNEYEGVFLAAFPIRTREGRPAWTTPEQKVIFAYRTTSCRGNMFFRHGDELPVDAETVSDYKLRIERFGHAFPLYLSKTNRGIEFAKASSPPPSQIATAKTVQKRAAESARKILTPPARKSTSASTPRPPPVKRYIVTPVGPSTNLISISTAEQIPSSAVPEKKEKSKDRKILGQLVSRGDKSDTIGEKPLEAVGAKAESIQQSKPLASAGVASNTTVPAASSSAGSQTAASKKTPPTNTSGWMTHFTKYQTPFLISVSLVLFIIGLCWESRRKARRRQVATKASTDALPASADVAGKPPPIPSSSNDFSGSIASRSLSSVAQSLNSDKETGTLLVKDNNNTEIGTLVFVRGEIIDAKSLDKRGIDAFYNVLRNKEGFFSFLREKPKNVEKMIKQDILSLLMDAHLMMDKEQMPSLPTSSTAPSTPPGAKDSNPPTAKATTRLKLHGNR
jgi:hypothetical protein